MPLLGSYGGSSEYAYRGTIDDFPNDFSFTNQTNAIPGDLFTSNQVTITGINNRALVRVSAGASVSVNGGSYVIPTEASPVFIFNNQTLSVRIPSTSGQLTDFNKLYSANVSVGKKTALWEVRTKIVDVDPTPFTFTNQTNGEIGIAYTSNEITISGLEAGFSFPADITSGSGQIIKNGGTGVPSVSIVNGDRIYLRLLAPFEYSEFPTGSGVKTNRTTVQVGSYSTSWSVSSRNVDVFINPFDFNDVNNALIKSVYTAESVNNLGLVTTITGADQGIPLVTAVTGCELQVEQPSAGGGFSIRRPFSTQNAVVFNGDKLTARITTGENFSETRIGIVTVSSERAQFIVTTRPRPIDTIPDAFTFTDITANRGATIESNEITLVGMTTFFDEGTASITTGTTGGNAQFQVTRGTSIIRSFGTANTPVRNGDKIKLKITAASDQNITRTATFRVDGIDTNIAITGTTGFRDDVWSVVSATRNCDITAFTLTTLNNVNRSTVQTISFTVDGFQSDCGMVVSASGGDLSVNGTAGPFSNNISVSPGTVVTLRVTSSSSFSTATTATVTVSNTSSGVIPNKSYSTTWTVNTVADNRATSVTLSANPTTVTVGNPVTLTWSSINAEVVTATTGEGFSTTLVTGTSQVTPTTVGTQNYSITVRGPSSSSAPGPITSAPVTVTVNPNNVPNDFSFNPSSLTNQSKSAEVSALAQSNTNSSVSVSGLGADVTVTASLSGSAKNMTVNGGSRVTSATVKNGDVIRVFIDNSSSASTTVTGTLNIGSKSSSFTSRTSDCNSAITTKNYANNTVTVSFKAATVQPNGQALNLYTGVSGSTGTQAKAGAAGADVFEVVTDGATKEVFLPNSVTQIEVAAVGGGGAGAVGKGGGGGGYVFATLPASGGQRINLISAARSDTRGVPGANSQVQVNGIQVVGAFAGRAGNIGGGGGGFGPPSVPGISGNAGGISGGSCGNGGSPGTTPPAGPPSLGGGGGGLTFVKGPSGGISVQKNNASPALPQGGNTTGTPGTRGGGGGSSAPSPSPVGALSSFNSAGSAALYYRGEATSGTTWGELINQIVTSFNTYKRRPPSDTEMDTYTARFTGTTSVTLSSLDGEIRDSTITVATSFTDSCGGTF